MKVILVALYSEKYPSIGESHGISVIAGAIIGRCNQLLTSIEVIDMVAIGSNDISIVKNRILDFKPDIIGFSVGFGTYDVLKEVFLSIKTFVESHHCLFLLGGAIPTYLQKDLIENIYEKFVLIIGEGDEAAPEIIEKWWLGNGDYHNIPNLLYKKNGKYIYTQRRLVHPNNILIPFRKGIKDIYKSGAQVFVESSRGCGWSSCTFCLRGLTDVRGKKDEYRRLDYSRIAYDLLALKEYEVNVFTFADEDFLGDSLSRNISFVDWFADFCITNEMNLNFDVSMTINSIFASHYSTEELESIKNILIKLKNIGLRKIFLGIESGSNSQLKRFAKGHSEYESECAINIVRELKIGLEIGFIMFDPLCTIEEVNTNINFLRKNNLAQFTSFFTNELRLQISSNYLKVLDIFEKKNNIKLRSENLDFNTLSYDYKYADQRVADLISMIKIWNSQLRPIHYPLKNLTRYGDGGTLGNNRELFLEILFELRNDYLIFMNQVIQELLKDNQIFSPKYDFRSITKKAANKILLINHNHSEEIIKFPIYKSLIENCLKELGN